MKYKHSKKFYDSRYKKYKAEMKKLGITPIKKGAFVSTYDALAEKSKNPMKDIVYSAQYSTKYKNALAEKKALSKVGINVKLEDLKKMSTYDFADMYANELAAAYRDERAKGSSAEAAKLLISQQWFGSN